MIKIFMTEDNGKKQSSHVLHMLCMLEDGIDHQMANKCHVPAFKYAPYLVQVR